MVDQSAGVEADPVAQSSLPVADITPEMLNKPQAPVANGGDAEFLKQKLELEKQDRLRVSAANKKLNEELQAIQAQFKALQDQHQESTTASKVNQGQYKELWEEAQKTIAGLKAEKEVLRQEKQSVAAEAEQDRLKVQAMQVIQDAGAVAPAQMYDLLQVQHGLRQGETGQVEVVVGGASTLLTDHLANLRNSPESGWQHNFAASGARGMGVTPSTTVAPGMNNPWRRETYNYTEQMVLVAKNPDLAAALKAEAGR